MERLASEGALERFGLTGFRRIHVYDFAVALTTTAATAFVYVVTTYGDKDFGSFQDYATAFAVGFLSQGIAIAWNLFPAFRSTALPPKPAAAQ
jgi:hypothetical protein